MSEEEKKKPRIVRKPDGETGKNKHGAGDLREHLEADRKIKRDSEQKRDRKEE